MEKRFTICALSHAVEIKAQTARAWQRTCNNDEENNVVAEKGPTHNLSTDHSKRELRQHTIKFV